MEDSLCLIVNMLSSLNIGIIIIINYTRKKAKTIYPIYFVYKGYNKVRKHM